MEDIDANKKVLGREKFHHTVFGILSWILMLPGIWLALIGYLAAGWGGYESSIKITPIAFLFLALAFLSIAIPAIMQLYGFYKLWVDYEFKSFFVYAPIPFAIGLAVILFLSFFVTLAFLGKLG